MPATTDYWINDQAGDPLLLITAELSASLGQGRQLHLMEQVRRRNSASFILSIHCSAANSST
jgi:hypothetical protein